MSINLNMNQGQDVSESQSALQPPRADNSNLTSQAPFIPTNPVQAGPFGQWLSTPSHFQFQHQPIPSTPFLGRTPSQIPPYCHQNSQPTSSQNPPFYQQNSQPPPSQIPAYYHQNPQSYPVFPSQQNPNPFQPAYQAPPPPPPPVASGNGGKNWTSEEDLQLCRAWVRVSEDAAIGVGQKKDKLWDRIKVMFHQLMNEVHGIESVRNAGACENHMRDLKLICSKWAGIRAQAFQQPASGLNLFDSESIAMQMWQDENKGKPFKYMACWNVLKECPRWYDPVRNGSDKSRGSSSQATVTQDDPPDTPVTGFAPVHTVSNGDRSETPPRTEESSTGGTGSLAERGNTCTPILNGPASKDIPRPPGQKISKSKNGRKKQRLSDAQEAASLTFRAGLVSLQASTNARWEKSREDQLLRDKINNQVLQEERRMQAKHHDLDLAKSRAETVDKITASGEKLLLAIQKLEELGAESVLTPNQKLQYNVRKKAVALHKRQYAELTASLERTEFQSQSSMEPMFESPRSGTSPRGLDYEEDEANLQDD